MGKFSPFTSRSHVIDYFFHWVFHIRAGYNFYSGVRFSVSYTTATKQIRTKHALITVDEVLLLSHDSLQKKHIGAASTRSVHFVHPVMGPLSPITKSIQFFGLVETLAVSTIFCKYCIKILEWILIHWYDRLWRFHFLFKSTISTVIFFFIVFKRIFQI